MGGKVIRAFCAEASEEKFERLRIVVAVGGNAWIRRGERLTIENQLKAARNECAPMIKSLLAHHQTVLTHGNGPQVGELALERSAATFDVLGAETQGQIGYVFSQAMSGSGVIAVPILTQVVVDPDDAAFNNPTKFVGPVYGATEADALSRDLGWTIKADGEHFRRVVPSPPPLEIVQIDAVKMLLDMQTPSGPLPIVCGGGGVPVTRMGRSFANIIPGSMEGLEAVIDKDRCGALLARELNADAFMILTDGGGIWENFGKPGAREMKVVSVSYLRGSKAGVKFPGSMGPKVAAAIDFVEQSTNPNAWAAIGDLKDAAHIVGNNKGTVIRREVEGDVVWYESKHDKKVDHVPCMPSPNMHGNSNTASTASQQERTQLNGGTGEEWQRQMVHRMPNVYASM
jgi:carbamate kinase